MRASRFYSFESLGWAWRILSPRSDGPVWPSPHIGVLVLTMFEDDDSVFAAMRAGPRGYLLKGAPKHVFAFLVWDVALTALF